MTILDLLDLMEAQMSLRKRQPDSAFEKCSKFGQMPTRIDRQMNVELHVCRKMGISSKKV